MKTDTAARTQQGQVTGLPLLNEPSSLSDAGWRRLQEYWFEPLFVADWDRAVFLHFTVDPEKLQPTVPFPLDLRNGKAWISLVAFTMRGMRMRWLGKMGRWIMRPIATHAFLNVRTYVKVANEPGIHFLAEWLPNPLAVALGPTLFGLPYHLGSIHYHHAPEMGAPINGEVADRIDGKKLKYHAVVAEGAIPGSCEEGSLDEFLLERYTAFVARQGKRLGYFRVWHRPWPQIRIEAEIKGAEILAHVPGANRWGKSLKFRLAHFSPGSADVAMGRPHRL